MTIQDFDIAVIGAGMAGATAAAFLSADKRVALDRGGGGRRLSHHRPLRRHLDPELRAAGRARADPAVAVVLRNPARRFCRHPADPPAARFCCWRRKRSCRTWRRRIATGQGIRRAIGRGGVRAGPGVATRLPRRRGDGGRRVRHGRRRDPSGLSPHAPRQRRCAGPAQPSRADRTARRRSGRSRRPSGTVFRAPVVVNAVGRLGRRRRHDRRRRAARFAALPAHRGHHRSVAVRRRPTGR